MAPNPRTDVAGKPAEQNTAEQTTDGAAQDQADAPVEVKQPVHDGPLARYEGTAPEPTKEKGKNYLPCPMCTNIAPVNESGVVSCPRCGDSPAGARF